MTKTGQIEVIIVAAIVALVLGLAAMVAASPAEAAFPGKNGKIAFQSDRNGPVEIYATVPGKTATRITTSNNSADPSYSPDGTKIAFVSTDNQVFVANADGSGRRQVTTSTAKSNPTWSPDGSKIAFVANSFDVDGQTDLEIWTINADGSGRTQLTNNSFPDTAPAWSPLGDRIAFVSLRTGDTNRNVYVMNADGTGQASITPNSPTGCTSNCYQGHDDDPTWSPDGSKIAYVHGYGPPTNPFAGGGVPNIWTMDPDGGNKVNVSDNPDVSATQPAWSPDGTKFAYVGVAPASTDRNVYVMNADGTGQGPIDTSAAHDVNPDWQQDSIPPNTTITSGPSGLVGSTAASFGFVSSETHSTFECSLDGAAFASCTSQKSYSNLKSGTHTFRVRATDIAGNADATPATRAWRVDAIGPIIGSMRPVPGSVIRDQTPTIRATVKDNLTNLVEGNIRLYVNGAKISAARYSYNASKDLLVYNSPKLSKRKNTVRVVATDGVGNVGARNWSFIIK